MNTGRRYYFLTIAETRNITRAAERLMVSQPSLTQYLNKLESELGVKLVDRHFTPLRLTEAGEIYRDYLLEQQTRDQLLKEQLRPFRPDDERTLTVGVPLQRSPDIAKRVLPGFISAHPDISLSVWEGTALSVRERVHAGELQLGFGYTYSGGVEPCIVQNLERERIVIVCNAENPIAAGVHSTPDEPAILPPSVCPACGGPVTVRGANLYCLNRESCRPQAVARLAHFASRDAMDITGFSEKTADLQDEINTGLKELNRKVCGPKVSAPRLRINNAKTYTYTIKNDTGTGSQTRGMLLFDLLMLQETALPAIIEDSMSLKQVEDAVILKIFDLFNSCKKQVFVTIDKGESYSQDHQSVPEIFTKTTVLELYPGHELFGRAWNIETN